MNKLLFTLVAFLATVGLHAEQVTKQEALQKAQQFMPDKKFKGPRSFARSESATDGEPFYIFNAEGNNGFVIVSGDDRTQPILGYADNGQLSVDNLPPSLKYWLDEYEQQMKCLQNQTVAFTRGLTTTKRKTVEPLIQTEWGQDEPYNTKCPLVYNSLTQKKEYSVTGCVATAMAQVMYYWKYPVAATSVIPAYKTSSLKIRVPELPSVVFDWNHMQPTYSGNEKGTSVDAVATLMRYCGQAMEMDYSLDQSGAAASTANMVKYFGYAKTARRVSRYSHTSSEWENLIYNEVSAGRPVIYSGRSIYGGHSFVCDGYKDGYFHLNWGWGGMSNGFFLLGLANPDNMGIGGGTSQDGYTMEQYAVLGLEPEKGEPEIQQFYAYFPNELETTQFSRVSKSDNFSGVSLPGGVFFQYDNTDQTGECTFETAWGLYQQGGLLKVLGASKPVTLKNYYVTLNNSTFSFGSGLSDGHYQFRQMFRLKGSSEWHLCETMGIIFVDAVISANTLTLRKSAEDAFTSDIKINNVTYSSSSFEVGRPVEVTVNLTNNGDSYQELIRLTCGDQFTIVCGSVEQGQTGEVKLHFTPNQEGQMTVNFSTDWNGKNIVHSETIMVEAPKPQSLSAKVTVPGLVDGVLTGTTLKVNASVTNNGTNTYENVIQLHLFQNTEDPASMSISGPLVKTTSVMTTIQPGEKKNIGFIVDGLNLDYNYFYIITYQSSGNQVNFSLPWNSIRFSLTEEVVKSGDVNNDTKVNAEDVSVIVRRILAGEYSKITDLNNDNKVDAADIVLLIKMIQGK